MYVTTDAMYRTWHLVFDKVLRDAEQQALLPILEHLLAGAVPAAQAQQRELAGTPLGEAAERATAYYEAAAVLAGLDLGTTSDRAEEEVELARKAAKVARSPVSGVVDCQFPVKFDGCVDYSLFLPRGHYDRTANLRRYFAAMSVLGQEWFGLGADNDGVLPGLLVTRVLVADPALQADWQAIYEPTAFLVGLADDVTPPEVAAAADAKVPGWRDDPSVLAGLRQPGAGGGDLGRPSDAYRSRARRHPIDGGPVHARRLRPRPVGVAERRHRREAEGRRVGPRRGRGAGLEARAEDAARRWSRGV